MKKDFDAKQKLMSCGYRVTDKRVKLLETIARADKPLATDELLKKLEKSMNRTTLYRALSELSSSKIIKTVDFGDKDDRYEINDENHHHHHIICDSCKKIEEIEDCAIESSLTGFAKKSKYFANINSHSLEFFGRCKACTK